MDESAALAHWSSDTDSETSFGWPKFRWEGGNVKSSLNVDVITVIISCIKQGTSASNKQGQPGLGAEAPLSERNGAGPTEGSPLTHISLWTDTTLLWSRTRTRDAVLQNSATNLVNDAESS